MQYVNLSTPLQLSVQPYPRKDVREGKNQLFCLADLKPILEVTRLEKHTSKIMAKAAVGSVYTILPLKFSLSDKGFVIQSDVVGIEELSKSLQRIRPKKHYGCMYLLSSKNRLLFIIMNC